MTHAAKKVNSGEYEYRGYKVEKCWDANRWNVTEAGDTYPCDTFSTFRAAKAQVDRYEDA